MQEDIERRSVSITVQGAKLTGKLMKQAIVALLKKWEEERNTPHVGQNTLRQIAGKDGDAKTIEVSGRIWSFERIARKHDVRYRVEKEIGVDPPKWTVYFRAPQADLLEAAFKQYTRKEMKREERKSVRQELRKNKELVKAPVVDRVKTKVQGGPEL